MLLFAVSPFHIIPGHIDSMTTTNRIFNFSAGPAVLPVEVLEEAQRDLIALPGVGMSILEISHRSKPFDEVIEGCEADLRALAGIPDELSRALPAGRREPAVLDGADEPAARRRVGRLHRDRRRGRRRRSKEAKRVGGVKIAGDDRRPRTSSACRSRAS